MKSVSLFCTEGSANKEYHAEMVAKDSGFVVNFRYGARGKAMKPGTKTESPVALDVATKIYEKLVAEKTGKGYTPDISGAAYTGTANAGRVSGWRPALLTPVDEAGVQGLLDSLDWMCSEKFDGERRAIEVTADGVVGINRKGLYVDIPSAWSAVLGNLQIGTILDAEHVGAKLHVFDCTRLGMYDIQHYGYQQRHAAIKDALGRVSDSTSVHGVVVVNVVADAASKRSMLKAIAAANGEGIVLRHVDAPYEAGVTPGSVKFKLIESATCIVAHVNPGVRSVGLGLLGADGNSLVAVGNVTIPANHAVPVAGDLVEVRYMHMFEGGSLYQPVYLGKRTDLEVSAATLAQVTRVKLKDAGESAGDNLGVGPASGLVSDAAGAPGADQVAEVAPRRRVKP